MQKAITKLGIDNEIINMASLSRDIRKKRLFFYLRQMLSPSFMRAKFGKIKFELLKKTLYAKKMSGVNERERCFASFKDNFVLSEQFSSMEELSKACAKYTDVIVGSDQNWLPINIAGDYYTLNFVPEHINKISYSTSFGVSVIPENYKERYRRFLNRIDYLSVREESGKKLIQQLTGRTPEIVCDPALLFDEVGWGEIIPSEKIIEGKYIFCYFLGGNINHRKFVKRLKEKTGCPIAALIHMEEYYKHDNSFADLTPYNVGPFEFVNLIRHAEHVCTDSYHGTIFSILHSKNFFTFKRHDDNSKMSTNTRVYSLLDAVDIKEKYLYGNEDVEKELENEIDYKRVHVNLNVIRKDSLFFIRDALRLNSYTRG